jgi:ABC-type nitrate/sulfonate/bicarbonate transport system ATPase subunit
LNNLVNESPLLQIKKLSKSYQGNQFVFADIHFDVNAHEVVCLLGASSCGKSSLLKALAGLHSVNSGEILFKGKALNKPDASIGVVFQDPCLLPWLNVQQNAAFALTLHRKANITQAEIQ